MSNNKLIVWSLVVKIYIYNEQEIINKFTV